MSLELAMILIFLLFGVISYLLGSVSFAVIFTRVYAHTDVRDHGSGNAGMTNVMRTAGMLPGVLTLCCDILKSAVSVLLGKYLLTAWVNHLLQHSGEAGRLSDLYGAAFCGLCCVLGHIFPVFFKFKGGKGVLSSFGMVVVLDWRMGLILLAVFGITFALFRMVSLASIMAAFSYPFVAFFLYSSQGAEQMLLFGLSEQWFQTLVALVFAAVIIGKHADNIKRIVHGQEKKFTIKKRRKE